MTALLTTEDTLILDEMLSHEVECESAHACAGNLNCSGPVTHRSTTTCGAPDLNVCAAYVTWFVSLIALHPRSNCSACGILIADDWTVTPA